MLLVLVLSVVLSSSLSYKHGCETGCSEKFLRTEYAPFLKANKITIVISSGLPPFVSQDGNGVPYGLDIDLINYIGFIYQIEFQYKYAAFSDLISTVQNNTNYISISSFFDTLARQEFVDFVDFFRSGSIFIVRSTYNQTINSLGDLCGKTVVIRAGTVQQKQVIAQNTTCGANEIQIVVVITIVDLIAAVQNGTGDVGLANQASLTTAVRASNNELKVVGTPYDIAPFGIACNKQNKLVSCAFASAVNYLIRIGIYEILLPRLAKWHRNLTLESESRVSILCLGTKLVCHRWSRQRLSRQTANESLYVYLISIASRI